jgi:hypothetical protein
MFLRLRPRQTRFFFNSLRCFANDPLQKTEEPIEKVDALFVKKTGLKAKNESAEKQKMKAELLGTDWADLYSHEKPDKKKKEKEKK